nr:F-box/kelch-repeat protein At2g29830-like [Quercus suber]
MNQERVILFCGYSLDEPVVYSKDDDYGKTRMSWFTMLAPEIRAGPSSSGILSSASSSSLLRKRKTNTFTPPTLSPFAVTNLPKSTFFTAVGTSIFIFHDGVNKILTFKNSGDGDWKLAPPMKHPRKSPHIIVLDGKLYVIGGLKYPLPANYCFMEVFDPDIGTWESLPNPPFMSPNPLYQPREMVTALLKNSYILVTSYTDSLFYIYQIFSRIWSPAPPVPNLSKVDFHLAPHKIKSVSVDDMLYRISFRHVYSPTKHLVIQAFKLSLNQWFEGCLNVGSEIFREYNEFLEDENPCCGLIHLCDQKFCLLLQSSYTEDGNGNGDFDRRRSAYFKRRSASSSYLYSVVLEVSPIFDKPMDLAGFMGLNITVLSTEKYRLVRPLVIQDAMLV